jgi:flagellar basal body L-ring protein FlgH
MVDRTEGGESQDTQVMLEGQTRMFGEPVATKIGDLIRMSIE